MDTYLLKLSILKVFMKRETRICRYFVSVTDATIMAVLDTSLLIWYN